MEKLPGVESAKVSLNEGRTVIQLKAGNGITLAQLRQSIQRNGFTPRDAVVRARTDVIATGEKLQLRISGTDETFDVATTADESILRQLRASAGQTVMVDGIVPTPKDPRSAPIIQVNGVKPTAGR